MPPNTKPKPTIVFHKVKHTATKTRPNNKHVFKNNDILKNNAKKRTKKTKSPVGSRRWMSINRSSPTQPVKRVTNAQRQKHIAQPIKLRTLTSPRSLHSIHRHLQSNCWRNTTLNKSYNEGGKWYVIQQGDNILSSARLDKNNTIWSLCTSKDHRGRGYAKQIVQKILQCNKKNSDVFLYIKRGGPRTFYEGLGFRLTNMSPFDRFKNGPNIRKMVHTST